MNPKIRQTAKSCRAHLETYAKLEKNQKAQWLPSLKGLCAIAAFYLQHRLLLETNIPTQIVIGGFSGNPHISPYPLLNMHCWLKTPEGSILDITATQFSVHGKPLPKVVLARKGHPLQDHYKTLKTHSQDPADFQNWGRHQNPYYRFRQKPSHVEILLQTHSA